MTVTIINARLSDSVETAAVCYPSRWQTSRQVGVNGLPHHNAVWSRPIGRWDIGFGLQSLAWGEIQTVITMHFVCRGARDGFLFRDPSDFWAEDEVIGIGDSDQTQFQLTKTYANTGGTYARIVKRPIADTVEVLLNGVTQPDSGVYTLDPDTGVITFNEPPPSGIPVEASFQFLKAVAFERDDLPIEVIRMNADDSQDGVVGVPSISLIEIPEA